MNQATVITDYRIFIDTPIYVKKTERKIEINLHGYKLALCIPQTYCKRRNFCGQAYPRKLNPRKFIHTKNLQQ